jgi:hypothetical protein
MKIKRLFVNPAKEKDDEQVMTAAKRQASVVSGGPIQLVLMYRQNQLHHCEMHLRLQSVNTLNA